MQSLENCSESGRESSVKVLPGQPAGLIGTQTHLVQNGYCACYDQRIIVR